MRSKSATPSLRRCDLSGAHCADGNFLGSLSFGSFAQLGREAPVSLPNARDHLYLAIEVGEVCQLKCRHCVYHRPKAPAPRPNELVFAKVRSAFDRGLDPLWVSFAGKEPTIFPKRLLEYAALTKRPERVNILMTNGLRLSGVLLEELAGLIDYFDISVDGDEKAHDWMRGPGTFRKTWVNIENILAEHDNHVGIIATLVHAHLPDGRKQYEDLIALARCFETDFGNSDKISLSISLYYGWPDDPMLLEADDIIRLIEGLAEIEFPCRILFTSIYGHLWPTVARRFGWADEVLEYDRPTGLPLLRRGNLSVVLFNLTETGQLGVRVSNDGYIYLGCNHLVLGDEASNNYTGDLERDDLVDIVVDLTRRKGPIMRALEATPLDCLTCAHWALCRGGDKLSGLYFNGRAEDPYCGLIAREAR